MLVKVQVLSSASISMRSGVASTISQGISVDESVNEFLRRHGGQEEFRKICELARSCFPALTRLEATLREVPDEVARDRVVVCVWLPEAYPDKQLGAGMRRNHEQVIAEIPLDHCPLFALVTEFVSE
jgi:hypothetical protein